MIFLSFKFFSIRVPYFSLCFYRNLSFSVASEDAEVSEVSDEKLTLPQPFINPSIINSNKRTVVYNAKEEILRHPTFSDEDAINFSDKYPSSGPVNPYTLPFPLRCDFVLF